MAAPIGTRPFAAFEWMLAVRYLRPRRKRASGLVIALFSFLGIMIGVATLIIVMAVMNGFREQLIDKILGLNGHLILQPMDTKLSDYADVAARIAKVPGVAAAVPLVEGQALASGPSTSNGALVRGVRARRSAARPRRRQQHQARHARQFRRVARHRHRNPARGQSRPDARRQPHIGDAARQCHAARRDAAHQGLSDRRDLRDRHVGIRFDVRVPAVPGGAGLFQPRGRGERHRGLSQQRRPGRRAAAGHRGGGADARSCSPTGRSGTPPSSPRSKSSGT